jgi:zinc and cadmium transporter
MPSLFQAMGFVLIAGFSGSLAASFFLLMPRRVRTASLPFLVSFAVGALTGAALFELLPHAVARLNGDGFSSLGRIFFLTLIGAFLLDKLLRWREQTRAPGAQSSGTLVLVSDGVHKLIDGTVVIAAFLTDPWLGLSAALAIIAHEIPHELSAIAILLNAGHRRRNAFLLKLCSSAAIIPAGLIALFWMESATAARPWVLTIAAAMFLYLALATLVPDLQREFRGRQVLLQMTAILAGASIIFSVHTLAH